MQIHTVNIITDITEMQENARKRHQEVLDVVEALSDATSSDRASSVCQIKYLGGISITFCR
jgi:propanediol dehydratase large subunit